MTLKHIALFLFASIGIAIPFGTGCRNESAGVPGGGGERPPQKVIYVRAKAKKVTEYVELVGRTAANESVEIQSRVSGFLLKTHFIDGQTVQANEVLFTIDPEEYKAIYLQSEAQIEVARTRLDVARKTFTRSKKLIENDAISREEFDQNQAAVEEAEARVIVAKADAARVKLDVDYTEVKSPIAGRVDRALLDDGNYVIGGMNGGTVLTTVVDDQPIKAIANVDENVRLKFMRQMREVAGEDFKQADKIAELNIPCELQLPDEVGYPHKGTLEYGEIIVDTQTGTSQVRAIFENKSGLLTPGMFVRLRIPSSEPHEAVVVPDVAIGTDQATKFVYIVNDENEIVLRTVKLGSQQEGLRVIETGVKAGDAVVIGGLQLVQPGMKVDPVEQAD
ncbi:efflux RND transporter periplasmic adaptor subunit [Allorhodopirellula heiligendammensis]|uniref:Multidrug efflux pump subunit AcrA n=1 Tax=Allorhodopirellula heiligendammensis TaxID=2714739 RepID=A0A5C6BGQ3_9BACT|nr:efflux RND transporter periplasmic adaptor subunit [Allorhodopirellula heiligendammensis]TWU10449.1 Multidrug efflux pump subunit AcrA precursor [Allorhodopirellula heiligendammensis]